MLLCTSCLCLCEHLCFVHLLQRVSVCVLPSLFIGSTTIHVSVPPSCVVPRGSSVFLLLFPLAIWFVLSYCIFLQFFLWFSFDCLFFSIPAFCWLHFDFWEISALLIKLPFCFITCLLQCLQFGSFSKKKQNKKKTSKSAAHFQNI